MWNDIRVTVKNGYGVMQEYSVDIKNWVCPDDIEVYVILGDVRTERKVRHKTMPWARAVMAAKDKIREREDIIREHLIDAGVDPEAFDEDMAAKQAFIGKVFVGTD